MYCKECGKALPDDAKFCISCGTEVFSGNGDFSDSAGRSRQSGGEANRTVNGQEVQKNEGEYIYKRDPEFRWNVEERPKKRIFDADTGEFNWETDWERDQKKAEHERLAQAARRERQRVEMAEKSHAEEMRLRAVAEEKQRLKAMEEQRMADAAEAMRKAEEMLAAHRAKTREEEEKHAAELLDNIDRENKMAEETAQNESAAKIDKFYTYNQKNEDFQKLLDEQYEKLKKRQPGGAVGEPVDLKVSKTEAAAIKHSIGSEEMLEKIAKDQEDDRETDELIQRSITDSRKFDTKELKRDIIEIALERAGVDSEMLDTHFDGPEDPREKFERERDNTMVLTGGLVEEESGFTPLFKKEAAEAGIQATSLSEEEQADTADKQPEIPAESIADEQRKRSVFEWLFGKGKKENLENIVEDLGSLSEEAESETAETVEVVETTEAVEGTELEETAPDKTASAEEESDADSASESRAEKSDFGEYKTDSEKEEKEAPEEIELNSQMSRKERLNADIRENETIRETMNLPKISEDAEAGEESEAEEKAAAGATLAELMQDPSVRAKKYRKGRDTEELEAREIANEKMIEEMNLPPDEAEAFRRKRALDALWGTMNIEIPDNGGEKGEKSENAADPISEAAGDSKNPTPELPEEEKPKKTGRKVVAAILLILLIGEGWMIGTTRLAPDSGAAKFINKNIPQAVSWVDPLLGERTKKKQNEEEAERRARERAEELTRKETNDRRIALVEKHISSNVNGNISNIVINPNLKFDKAAKYAVDDVLISKPIVSVEWYKSEDGTAVTHEEIIIATLLAYESLRVDFENSGVRKLQDYIARGTQAEQDAAEKLSKNGEKMAFDKLEIGEIRVGNEYFYVWTRETLKFSRSDGSGSEKIFQKIYCMSAVDNKMYISKALNF